jgi:hypothetical protein
MRIINPKASEYKWHKALDFLGIGCIIYLDKIYLISHHSPHNSRLGKGVFGKGKRYRNHQKDTSRGPKVQ